MKKQSPFGKIEVFDSHVHFFSHNYFRLLAQQSPSLKNGSDSIEKIAEMAGFQMPPEDPSEFAKIWIAELDKNQVAKALIMSSLPGDEDSVAVAVEAFPDRFYGAFFFNPLQPDAIARLRRAFEELNLKVVCLFPAMHGFSVADNESVRQVLEIVKEEKGRAVFIHCGALSIGIRKKLGLKSVFDLRLSNPLDVHKVASEFTEINFIIPHFGAGLWRETLMVAELCPNIYLDTSSSNRWMRYQSADLDIRKVFEKTLSVVGSERLLFGTDSSFFPRGWNKEIFDAQAKALAEIGISKQEAENIFAKNLLRLLS